MVVGNSDDGAGGGIFAREVLAREEVLLRGIEGVPSLTKHRDSKTTVVNVKFGAVGFRGDATILQAQWNACSQPGLSGRVNPSSLSRLFDEPGTQRGRFAPKVGAHSFDDEIVCGRKALPNVFGVISQEAIPHLYNAWRGTIHRHGLKHICEIPFHGRDRERFGQGNQFCGGCVVWGWGRRRVRSSSDEVTISPRYVTRINVTRLTNHCIERVKVHGKRVVVSLW